MVAEKPESKKKDKVVEKGEAKPKREKNEKKQKQAPAEVLQETSQNQLQMQPEMLMQSMQNMPNMAGMPFMPPMPMPTEGQQNGFPQMFMPPPQGQFMMPVPEESVLKELDQLRGENERMKAELAQLRNHEQVTLDLQLENQNLKNQVSTLKESRAQEAQQRKQKEQNAKVGAEKLEQIVAMANEELRKS